MIGHFKMKETGPFRRFARAINEQARVVKAATVRSSHNVRVSRTSNGTYLVPMVKAEAAGSTICKAVVLEVGSDWIRVRKSTDTVSSIYVAKPENLQQTITDGRTWRSYTMTFPTATDSTLRRLSRTVQNSAGANVVISVDEIVDPPYVIEDGAATPPAFSEIYMAKATSGITDPDGEDIAWIDMNVDARVWVRELTHYRFCEASVPKDGTMAGGAPV